MKFWHISLKNGLYQRFQDAVTVSPRCRVKSSLRRADVIHVRQLCVMVPVPNVLPIEGKLAAPKASGKGWQTRGGERRAVGDVL